MFLLTMACISPAFGYGTAGVTKYEDGSTVYFQYEERVYKQLSFYGYHQNNYNENYLKLSNERLAGGLVYSYGQQAGKLGVRLEVLLWK